MISGVDEVNVGPALHDEHLEKVEPERNKTLLYSTLSNRVAN
jgi:hypothetical protein